MYIKINFECREVFLVGRSPTFTFCRKDRYHTYTNMYASTISCNKEVVLRITKNHALCIIGGCINIDKLGFVFPMLIILLLTSIRHLLINDNSC